MAARHRCPETSHFQQLLDDSLADDQRMELASHLKDCADCQKRFEELAALSELADRGDDGVVDRQPTGESRLDGVIVDLLAELPDAAVACGPSTTDDVSLDFLSPSNNPEHLGRLGSYEVVEVIGQGGMGVVLKAYDAGLNRLVAVKVLAPQLASNPTARKRFRREAQAAAAVSHDHVVAIHAVDEAEGLPFLVMEFVDGRSLDQRIKGDGSLELKEILRIGMQVAAGLAAAHAQGLVHRDIKPSNILLENGVERVKITDFGLARAADDVHFTQSGVVAGTPHYMSPEQARGETVDHRSDLFCLGCVLYAMCTGRPPFRAETVMGAIRRTCEDTPRPIGDVNAEMPDWLTEIIDRLLAKTPDDRLQSASEVSELLGGHLAHLQEPTAVPQPQRVAPPTKTPRPRTPRGRRRRFAIAMLVALPLLGVLVGTETTGVTKVVDTVAAVLHIKTPAGTLVVKIMDPNVRLVVDAHGGLKFTGIGEHTITLRPGRYRWKEIRAGAVDDTGWVTIERGGRQVVKVEVPKPAAPAQALRRDAVQWPLSEGGNGHGYVVVHEPSGITWAEADCRAKAAGGYLATITSKAENDFVFSLADKPELWRKRSGWSSLVGPWVGGLQEKGAAEPAGGWRWGTEEAFVFENWRFFEPDDNHARHSAGEDRICFFANSPTRSSHWADIEGINLDVVSYVVEFGESGPRVPTPQPLDSALTVELTDDNSRVVVSRGGHRKTLVHKAKHTVGLPSGICDVDVYDVAEDKLIRSGQITLPHGSHLYAKIHQAWRNQSSPPPSPAPSAVLPHQDTARTIAVSPDGTMIAIGGRSRDVGLWRFDGQAWQKRPLLSGHANHVYKVAFSPDGKLLATSSKDGTVKLWDVFTGQFLKNLLEHEHRPYTVAFSPDGSTVAVGGRKKTVYIVGVETGQVHRRLVGHTGLVARASFSPDGKTIATGSDDRTIKLWDVVTGKVLDTHKDHKGKIWGIAFSADGKMLASASEDTTVKLWDLRTGRVIKTLANPASMSAVAFSPDGKTLAGGGTDATVRLWDSESGELRSEFYAHWAPIREMAFLPDGKTLATASWDATAKLWDVAELLEGAAR